MFSSLSPKGTARPSHQTSRDRGRRPLTSKPGPLALGAGALLAPLVSRYHWPIPRRPVARGRAVRPADRCLGFLALVVLAEQSGGPTRYVGVRSRPWPIVDLVRSL